jgi:Leucine-rich repeat (LRR) protein
MLANSITRSDVEEESSPPYLEDVVTDSKEKITNLEDTTPMATPQFATSSNKLNDPPMALGSTKYVLNKV